MTNSWDALAGFESRDLITRFFNKRHGLKPNAGKVREISAAFIQGRQYFTSATSADIAVKPLLLYYGVLSLSRALVLALSPNLRETSLKPSHGLEVRNWQPALANKDIAGLEICAQTGTFSELLAAVGNTSYYRFNSSHVRWGVTFPPFAPKQIFTFYELASGFPDLERELLAWSENAYQYGYVGSIEKATEPGATAFTCISRLKSLFTGGAAEIGHLLRGAIVGIP